MSASLPVAGYSGKLYYAADSAGSPGSFTLIEDIKASTWKRMYDMLDITNFGSAGWKQRLAGLGDTDLSNLEGFYSEGGEQTTLRTAIDARGQFWLKILPDGTNGIYLPVIGESYQVDGKVDGVVSFNFSVKANGAATVVGTN